MKLRRKILNRRRHHHTCVTTINLLFCNMLCNSLIDRGAQEPEDSIYWHPVNYRPDRAEHARQHTRESDEDCSACHPSWLRPLRSVYTGPCSTRYTTLTCLVFDRSLDLSVQARHVLPICVRPLTEGRLSRRKIAWDNEQWNSHFWMMTRTVGTDNAHWRTISWHSAHCVPHWIINAYIFNFNIYCNIKLKRVSEIKRFFSYLGRGTDWTIGNNFSFTSVWDMQFKYPNLLFRWKKQCANFT